MWESVSSFLPIISERDRWLWWLNQCMSEDRFDSVVAKLVATYVEGGCLSSRPLCRIVFSWSLQESCCEDCKNAGYNAESCRKGGFRCSECRAVLLVETAGHCKESGFICEDCKAAGFSATECRVAGFS